ncbi:MAG: aminotransferase class I/II-fold pyridoxal phosphate-dependent enzyme [Mariprofundaceae bacterium]|nr:aminotransferase class I/II-fold pyridoxal phosphate-dependent enzyme [Mariprofundaceae bacterium]
MRRIDLIEPFRVMQLLERAKQLEGEGKHIVHMEIGEPDFPTPAPVIEAARNHLATGENFYTPSTGSPQLQQAIADWYANEYNVQVAPERILITPGSSGAFSLIYAVLLDAGESVLLPDPGYPCQRNFVRLAGGEAVNIPVGPETRYHLSAAQITDNWQPKTRAAVVINPGNPTGTLIDEAELSAIASCCAQKGGWLISDEIYHGLSYGEKPPCALQFSDNGGDCGHTIIVNSFSKRWAMTGWRVGWLIVPENLIDAARRVMQNIFIAAPTISQLSAISALSSPREAEAMRAAYDERRRYLLEALPQLGFDIVVEPQGAFYIYANVQKLSDDSRTFCWDMLEKVGVAITPGEDFGSYRASEHVRFSYATSLDDIKEGLRRLATPCKQALARNLAKTRHI